MSWRTSLGEVIECLTCYCEWQGTGHPPEQAYIYNLLFRQLSDNNKKEKERAGSFRATPLLLFPLSNRMHYSQIRKKERKKERNLESKRNKKIRTRVHGHHQLRSPSYRWTGRIQESSVYFTYIRITPHCWTRTQKVILSPPRDESYGLLYQNVCAFCCRASAVDTTFLCLSLLLPIQFFLLLLQSLLKSLAIRSICRQYTSGVKHGRKFNQIFTSVILFLLRKLNDRLSLSSVRYRRIINN